MASSESKVVKGKLPFSALTIFRSGYASDMTMSAGGISFKFHQPIVSACSPVLAAALEYDKDIELKCSAITLTHVHTAMYGSIISAKTPLNEAWDLFCFAEQYDLKFIKDGLLIAIPQIIENVDIPSIMKTLETFDIKMSLKITSCLFNRFIKLMHAIGTEEKFCENKLGCCKHNVECEDTSMCCKCRSSRTDEAVEYTKIELAKIYEQVLTLPATIQAKLFYWMA